jgi:hypothetical protein
MKYIIVGFLISIMSVMANAAGVSNTHYSGTNFSKSFTVGGSVDSSSYIGGSIASESAQGAFSVTKDIYIGSDVATSSYRERSNTTTSFNGDVVSNGLVATSTENSSSITGTRGKSVNTSAGVKVGKTLDYSNVGNATGVEFGSYSNSYGSLTKSKYGSTVYADSYSSSSYGI